MKPSAAESVPSSKRLLGAAHGDGEGGDLHPEGSQLGSQPV